MSIADWILSGTIAAYCFWLIFRRKKKKCSHNCDCCSGCCH